MAYLWNSVFETGHEIIDGQHRQLFGALNNITSAFWAGTGADEVQKTLSFLTDYTVMHFKTEEDLMIKYKYRGYSAHKKTHDDFKVTAGKLAKKLHDEGPNEDLIVNVTTKIGDWLISHIKVDDMEMAAYVITKEK